MKGVDVTVFDDGRRPDLIVGESLIPAVVPVLRRLGLEERAAAICERKPGVTFTFGVDERVEFCFQSLAGTRVPTYAYNAPRPAFDRLFDERADELGAKRVRVRAKIERAGRDGLRLAEETLAQAPWLGGRFDGAQPPFCAHAGDSRGGRPAQGRGVLRPLRRFY
jgi:flavin-dependent dehydrogenase